MIRYLVPSLLAAVVFAGAVLAQHRSSNEALLGVVAAPAEKKGVAIARVLPKSPAAAAKMEAGDRILAIGKKEIGTPADVDAALAEREPGKPVAIVVVRDGKKRKVAPKLIARKEYEGEELERTRRGKTGFPAPAWHAWAWANVEKGEEPPTRENTKGKVVVFHCFQSW